MELNGGMGWVDAIMLDPGALPHEDSEFIRRYLNNSEAQSQALETTEGVNDNTLPSLNEDLDDEDLFENKEEFITQKDPLEKARRNKIVKDEMSSQGSQSESESQLSQKELSSPIDFVHSTMSTMNDSAEPSTWSIAQGRPRRNVNPHPGIYVDPESQTNSTSEDSQEIKPEENVLAILNGTGGRGRGRGRGRGGSRSRSRSNSTRSEGSVPPVPKKPKQYELAMADPTDKKNKNALNAKLNRDKKKRETDDLKKTNQKLCVENKAKDDTIAKLEQMNQEKTQTINELRDVLKSLQKEKGTLQGENLKMESRVGELTKLCNHEKTVNQQLKSELGAVKGQILAIGNSISVGQSSGPNPAQFQQPIFSQGQSGPLPSFGSVASSSLLPHNGGGMPEMDCLLGSQDLDVYDLLHPDFQMTPPVPNFSQN